jgi:hypothetical protein
VDFDGYSVSGNTCTFVDENQIPGHQIGGGYQSPLTIAQHLCSWCGHFAK